VLKEDDRKIIARCLNGERGAFEELLNKYRGKVYSICLRMVRNPVDAEDIAQEVFIRVFSALDRYDPAYPFSAWIYRITANLCIDFLRREKDRPVSIDKPISGEDGDYRWQLPSGDAGPDRIIHMEEMFAVLEEALAQIPEQYRMILLLRHEEHLSYEEIADVLGIPIGTVKARIHRARNMIRKIFKSRGLLDEISTLGEE